LGIDLVVGDPMAFVVAHYAFRADVYLVVFAEIFGFLLGVLQAELVYEAFLLFFLLLSGILLNSLVDVGMETGTHATKGVYFLFVVNVV